MSAVTIGIPVQSELDPFRHAVRSLFAQTMTDWTLVVACDGSDEAVVRAARAIDDPRVEVLADGRSLGLPARLNQISEIATTPYVARMDADDVMRPDRLEAQVAVLAKGGVDLVGSRAYMIDEDGRVDGLFDEPGAPRDRVDLLRSGAFTHPTVMFTREWAMRFPYDSAWIRTEDKEVWFRASAGSTFHKLAEPLLYYRVPRSMSIAKQALTARYDRRFFRAHAAQAGVGALGRGAYATAIAYQAVGVRGRLPQRAVGSRPLDEGRAHRQRRGSGRPAAPRRCRGDPRARLGRVSRPVLQRCV